MVNTVIKDILAQQPASNFQGNLHRELHTALDKMKQHYTDEPVESHNGSGIPIAMIRTYSAKLSDLGLDKTDKDYLPVTELLRAGILQKIREHGAPAASPWTWALSSSHDWQNSIPATGELQIKEWIPLNEYKANAASTSDIIEKLRLEADELLFDMQKALSEASLKKRSPTSKPGSEYLSVRFDDEMTGKYSNRRQETFDFDRVVSAICEKHNFGYSNGIDYSDGWNPYQYGLERIEAQQGKAMASFNAYWRKDAANSSVRRMEKELLIGNDPALQRQLEQEFGIVFERQQARAM